MFHLFWIIHRPHWNYFQPKQNLYKSCSGRGLWIIHIYPEIYATVLQFPNVICQWETQTEIPLTSTMMVWRHTVHFKGTGRQYQNYLCGLG